MHTNKRGLRFALSLTVVALLAAACSPSRDQQAARGAYLVKVIGCGDCHTPGGFTGKPDMNRLLAGADGVIVVSGLGTYAPSNLTPDKATGIGAWTTDQIAVAITKGVTPSGRILSPAMPWNDFGNLSKADADDIALYLHGLPSVSHAVPEPSAPQSCGGFECVVAAPAPHS